MAMREKFTKPDSSIYYYLVEWDSTGSAKLSWEDFRGKVLGATDPSTAAPGSLRKEIFTQWKGRSESVSNRLSFAQYTSYFLCRVLRHFSFVCGSREWRWCHHKLKRLRLNGGRLRQLRIDSQLLRIAA